MARSNMALSPNFGVLGVLFRLFLKERLQFFCFEKILWRKRGYVFVFYVYLWSEVSAIFSNALHFPSVTFKKWGSHGPMPSSSSHPDPGEGDFASAQFCVFSASDLP